MDKGDIVKIKAEVRTVRERLQMGIYKTLRRYESRMPFTGIVLGYSFLCTGRVIEGKHYDEPNYLDIEKRHKVFVIEPREQYKSYLAQNEDEKAQKTNRYLEPVRCFEDDLEVIE